MENRSFDHLLGFQGITGKDTQTGAATKAEDLTGLKVVALEEYYKEFANLRYTVSPTAGDTTYNKHDVKHQFPDVLTQLCGQAQGQTLLANHANHGLKDGKYPQIAEATKRGFAADYVMNSDSTNPGEPMRCFAPGALPVLTALAKEFVLCDHWFSSMAGPTEPNRMFAHAATSGAWDDSPSNGDY
jgi:phospholipase C